MPRSGKLIDIAVCYQSAHPINLLTDFLAPYDNRSFSRRGISRCGNLRLFLLGFLNFFVAAFVIALGHRSSLS